MVKYPCIDPSTTEDRERPVCGKPQFAPCKAGEAASRSTHPCGAQVAPLRVDRSRWGEVEVSARPSAGL